MITPSSALLVIDMQKGSFTPLTPRFEAKEVVQRINKLATGFRSVGAPVIFIQHDGTRDGEFLPGNQDWELLDELERVPADILIAKTANDSFYESNLQQTLAELSVNRLYITGCATDFCVESTIQSALAKDFMVHVVQDAHTTADRPHLPAQKVIEHYNWVWENMIPTKGEIRVINTAQVIV